MPLYENTTTTEVMSISGRMSVPILRMVTTEVMTSSSANTTNVYGLRKASSTSHMSEGFRGKVDGAGGGSSRQRWC
ncbi:hypothetical protein LBMAG53_23480 [Planctomycetota bacterium]|nr:hypothetical protein LBMAG53_23480 [Planctomycetota bacterium]